MKAHVIFVTMGLILTLASTNVYQENPVKACFYVIDGIVEIPVKADDSIESLPDCVKSIAIRDRAEYLNIVNTQFDLSTITKPEPDADDVTIDTKQIFQDLMFQQISKENIWVLL